VKRRISSLAAASALALSIPFVIGPAAVLAGPPTEIYVSPTSQNTYCPPFSNSERADWTIALGGGTSGDWSVTAQYGDGQIKTTKHSDSYSAGHDFAPCLLWHYNQSWTASRNGGGSGHDNTDVWTT